VRIIILGAGAIGSLFGAKLAARNDVTLVGRAEHVRAINERGLRIEGQESQTVRVHAAERIERITAETLILLTTKTTDTAAALAQIASVLREDTTILSLQNGLGAEALARSALHGAGVVLRGITQFGAIFDSPGVVRYMFEGYTVVEPHERSEAIVNVLNAARLNARVSTDIRRDVWHKTIFNCVVNPITTMIGREVGAIADRELDELKQLVIDECLRVSAADGVSLENNFLHEINELFAPSKNVVSTLQDLRRGRRTEIDYMNGAVVKLGARHGIDCPVNSALTAIVKAMEARRSLFPKEMLQPQSS
jgi:2-dehydropantoate 2-reductase